VNLESVKLLAQMSQSSSRGKSCGFLNWKMSSGFPAASGGILSVRSRCAANGGSSPERSRCDINASILCSEVKTCSSINFLSGISEVLLWVAELTNLQLSNTY